MIKLFGGERLLKKKREPRIETKLPVKLGDMDGLTVNISASGVFFEMEKDQKEGSIIKFNVELNTPGGPFLLACQARVVRVQEINGRYGIATQIISQEFQSLAVNKSNQ